MAKCLRRVTNQRGKVCGEQHVDDHRESVGLGQLQGRFEGSDEDDAQAPQQVADEGNVDLSGVLQHKANVGP